MEEIPLFNKPFIVFRIRSEEAYESAKKICKYLIESNYVEYLYVEKLSELNSEIVFGNKDKDKYFKLFNLETEDSNICILIGGDGTCLWANKLYENKKRPPFLSFYGGNIGFLSIYDKEKYVEILDNLYSSAKNDRNSINYIHRNLVRCDVYETEENKEKNYEGFDGYQKKYSYNGLNEITVERKAGMVNLKVYLNEDFLSQLSADGIIVATSTGSTAYNLSAGGPIIHNHVEGLILNAICPFSLSLRPIVFPKNSKIRVRNNPKFNNKAIIRYDGNAGIDIKDNQYLEVYLSDLAVDFIVLKSISGSVDKLWIKKISNSLGWNFKFTH